VSDLGRERSTIPLAGRALAPISAAVRWGDLVFVSGIVAIDPVTGQGQGEGVEEQAAFVLDELAAVLARAGTDLAHVLRVECFLGQAEDFAGWNAVFGRYFPSEPPARTTLVAGFAFPGLRLEVQATAGVPGFSQG
jgi:2-iminobutanoate/2-iminopropanoate deaminase